uniref:Vezatin n=1 Tax=Acrobeloides nanus TaxID=290746 RepID=A0A914BZ92_9BILA
MVFVKHLTRKVCDYALCSGLLEDDDLALVEENLYLIDSFRFPVAELLFIFSFPGTLFFIYDWESAVVALISLLSLYALWDFIHYWIFKQILSSWLSFDEKSNQFLVHIRQKEIITFRLQHAISNEDAILCAKISRLSYLKTLRRVLHNLQYFSAELAWEKENLIENFANDDLLSLSSLDTEITGDHLRLSSLKALWQYLFLSRSELLRLYLLVLLKESQTSFSFNYWRTIFLFKIACATLPTLFVRFETALEQNKKLKRNQARPPNIVSNDHATCIAQLEWILERLYEVKQLPSDTTILASVLRNTLEILDHSSHPKTESNKGDIGKKLISTEDLISCEKDYLEESTVESGAEYEIYEATVSHEDPIDRRNHLIDDDIDFMLSKKTETRSVVNELKTALKARKSECLAKEREALARFRNVPLEEILPSELDDDDLLLEAQKVEQQSSKFDEINSNIRKEEDAQPIFIPSTIRAQRPTVEDLQSILRRRQFQMDENVIGDEEEEENF